MSAVVETQGVDLRAEEASTIAYGFTDFAMMSLLRDGCYQVLRAPGDAPWFDVEQPKGAVASRQLQRAVHYLDLRGKVERHQAFPMLVRFTADPVEDPT